VDVVVAYFMVLLQTFSGKTEENHEKLRHDR
jgi:hypothetical protein